MIKQYVSVLSLFSGDALRDRQLYLALAVAPFALGCIAVLAPSLLEVSLPNGISVLMLVLWSPLIEEVLFRGFIQGWAEQSFYGQQQIGGITAANLLASLLFSMAHLLHQPPIWAVLVFIPSLVFGYFRTRHGNLTSPIVLHSTYNGFYCLFITQF